jgi:hypothetical protein
MEELHNMYSSPSIITEEVKEDEMSRPFSRKGCEEECMWIISGEARKKETTRKVKI